MTSGCVVVVAWCHTIGVVAWCPDLVLARYDQGREDGAVIDDWEDPKLEIYHTQDRWGLLAASCYTKLWLFHTFTPPQCSL